MTDEKARLRWFFNRTSDDVKRCALAVGAIYLDLLKQQPANAPATVEPFDDDDIVDDETTNAPETPANNAPVGETLEETRRRRRRELGIKGYED